MASLCELVTVEAWTDTRSQRTPRICTCMWSAPNRGPGGAEESPSGSDSGDNRLSWWARYASLL